MQTSYMTYTSYNWSSISLSQHNPIQQNNEKIHNAISEVCKGDCIIMGDFNHGNIKWDSLQSAGVEDQRFVCLGHFPNATCIRTNQSSDGIRYSAILT